MVIISNADIFNQRTQLIAENKWPEKKEE